MRKFPALKMTQSLRSIVVLSAGSLAAQALNFIGSIVIAKQYSDFSIGQFTYFLSIVAMFSTVINGRYDVQIVSAKSDDEVNALVKLSSLVMFVFCQNFSLMDILSSVIRIAVCLPFLQSACISRCSTWRLEIAARMSACRKRRTVGSWMLFLM